MSDLNIYIHGENSRREEVRSGSQAIRSILEAESHDQTSQYHSWKMELNPQKEELKDRLESSLIKHYSQFGISKDEIKFPRAILTTFEIPTPGHRDYTDVIKINRWHSYTYPSDEEYNTYLQAKTMAEEMYHYTAPMIFGLSKEYLYEQERGGLGYQQDSALEEGMAARYRQKAKTIISGVYPEQAKLEEDLIRDFKDNNPQHTDKQLDVKFYQNGKFGIGEDAQKHSLALVNYLDQLFTQHGANFMYLAERARVLGETLTLAKVTESIFGKGSYRRIAEAGEENAEEIIAELAHSINTRIEENNNLTVSSIV